MLKKQSCGPYSIYIRQYCPKYNILYTKLTETLSLLHKIYHVQLCTTPLPCTVRPVPYTAVAGNRVHLVGNARTIFLFQRVTTFVAQNHFRGGKRWYFLRFGECIISSNDVQYNTVILFKLRIMHHNVILNRRCVKKWNQSTFPIQNYANLTLRFVFGLVHKSASCLVHGILASSFSQIYILNN